MSPNPSIARSEGRGREAEMMYAGDFAYQLTFDESDRISSIWFQ